MLYSKNEEYNPSKIQLDKYDRFSYSTSKHKNILNPEVSKFLIQNGFQANYPDNKDFTVCLTHDIDLIYFPELKKVHKITKKILKSQVNRIMGGVPNKLYGKINRLWNFNKIMELETKYGAKSSFYFLAMDKLEPDFRYELSETGDLLKEIVRSGWEVGLHGGLNAYNDIAVIKKEKEQIEKMVGKAIIGYRNHYMKFEVPTTWELLKDAGFKYDTTYGYFDHVGFRNGMCHPFKPWNLLTNELIDILELPLIIMDSTLNNYMKLNVNDSWQITKQLIDTVAKYHGVITILWHNNSFNDEMLNLYEKILKYCNEKNAWLTSGKEIFQWWNKNKFFNMY